MKPGLIIGLCLFSQAVRGDGLPVITAHPTSQTVVPGNTATMTVTATGATSYQWRHSGTNIPGAVSATLQVQNAQTTDAGYYMAVVKNATGWVPSQMAWLSVVSGSGGVVPFSNKTNTSYFQGPVYNVANGNLLVSGRAWLVAGPQLDQMQTVGSYMAVLNGYYGTTATTRSVPTVAPGQDVYYRVDVLYTNSGNGYTQPSTVMRLTAGGGGFDTPSVFGLKFAGWWVSEGLEPVIEFGYPGHPTSPTNQLRVPGETLSLSNFYFAYTDFGRPTAQWRKNGMPILGATNFPPVGGDPYPYGGFYESILTLTNVQPDDAGIYDLIVYGNEWIVGPKMVLSIQVTNGPGFFQSPRLGGTNFVCDLLGAAGRNYTLQWSTNLFDWHDLTTLSNITGTVTFTNAPPPGGAKFYRTKLQP
jgi:hypothetical protein